MQYCISFRVFQINHNITNCQPVEYMYYHCLAMFNELILYMRQYCICAGLPGMCIRGRAVLNPSLGGGGRGGVGRRQTSGCPGGQGQTTPGSPHTGRVASQDAQVPPVTMATATIDRLASVVYSRCIRKLYQELYMHVIYTCSSKRDRHV